MFLVFWWFWLGCGRRPCSFVSKPVIIGRNLILASRCIVFGTFVMQSNIGGVSLICLWLLLLLSSPCTDGGCLPSWGHQRSTAGPSENSAQLRNFGALRGGQLHGAEEKEEEEGEEEEDQRIENTVVNETEWLKAVGKASSLPENWRESHTMTQKNHQREVISKRMPASRPGCALRKKVSSCQGYPCVS